MNASQVAARVLCLTALATVVASANAEESIRQDIRSVAHGAAIHAIDGSAIQAIDGSAIQAIDGSAILAIDGSAIQAIDGSAILAIDGSAIQAIDGSGISTINPSVYTSSGISRKSGVTTDEGGIASRTGKAELISGATYTLTTGRVRLHALSLQGQPATAPKQLEIPNHMIQTRAAQQHSPAPAFNRPSTLNQVETSIGVKSTLRPLNRR